MRTRRLFPLVPALGAVFSFYACGGDSAAPPGTTADAGSPDVVVVTEPPPSDAGATDAAAPVARLAVHGADIVDPNGNPILLRGWNWGLWGTAQSNDGTDNAQQGANVVRIPLRWWGPYPDGYDSYSATEPSHLDPAHLTELDRTVDLATNAGLWVDLFVDSNCGQQNDNDTIANCGTGDDGNPANFVNSSAKRSELKALWSFLAQHYATHANIAMYEILAEPEFGCKTHSNCADWTLAPKLYTELIPVLRAQDPRTPILVGPNGAYHISALDTAIIPNVDNLIYTADLFLNTLQDPDWLTSLQTFRSTHSVPVFIQQVGVRYGDVDGGTFVGDQLAKLDGAKIGWTWWDYRETHATVSYSPWYLDNGQWKVHQDWLDLITSYFH